MAGQQLNLMEGLGDALHQCFLLVIFTKGKTRVGSNVQLLEVSLINMFTQYIPILSFWSFISPGWEVHLRVTDIRDYAIQLIKPGCNKVDKNSQFFVTYRFRVKARVNK